MFWKSVLEVSIEFNGFYAVDESYKGFFNKSGSILKLNKKMCVWGIILKLLFYLKGPYMPTVYEK